MRCDTGLECCGGNDVLPRRIDVLRGELRLVRAIGHASIVNPATVGLRQREWDRANGDEQKQVKGTPDKVRFDLGANLSFHGGDVFWGFQLATLYVHVGYVFRRGPEKCQAFS